MRKNEAMSKLCINLPLSLSPSLSHSLGASCTNFTFWFIKLLLWQKNNIYGRSLCCNFQCETYFEIPKTRPNAAFYWVIKNVCNSKTIMSTAAARSETSPQEMSYFLCCLQNILCLMLGWKFWRGPKGGKICKNLSKITKVFSSFFFDLFFSSHKSLMTGKVEI